MEIQVQSLAHSPDKASGPSLADLVRRHSGSIRVLLHGFPQTGLIPLKIIRLLGSSGVLAIERIERYPGGIRLLPHRPLQNVGSKTLIVFPGPIIPLTMGSHQRAFQMAAALAARGKPADLLVTCQNKKSLRLAIPILEQVCGTVYLYSSRKARMPFGLRFRRSLEWSLRLLTGDSSAPPLLFEERLEMLASFSGQKALRLLAESRRYSTIIMHYAWLSGLRRLLCREDRERITWVCDTHDVQHLRNATVNDTTRRFLHSPARERSKEIETLASFDKVLAISPPDAAQLTDELGADKVVLNPTGFDYALAEPCDPSPDSLTFGFIGRNMHANEMALDVVIDEWWPEIRKQWPQARLRIAGSICKGRKENPMTGVILDHIVPELDEWYAGIDIALNPTLVLGGLNFKSVEAVMACKLLVTTPMGAACLGKKSLCITANSPQEVVDAVLREIQRPDYVEARRIARDSACAIFGDEAANRKLCEIIEVSSNRCHEQPAIMDRPKRVLIQCGDLEENRIRIHSLARALQSQGHHPIVMVYSKEMVGRLLSQGIDSVALDAFRETRLQSMLIWIRGWFIQKFSATYRGVNLDDVTLVRQMQSPRIAKRIQRMRHIRTAMRYISRCQRLLAQVRPDHLVIWNGYTGWVANVLRVEARNRSLPRHFLERSLLKDGVFVDPYGTNGSSLLANMSFEELEPAFTGKSDSPAQEFSPAPDVEELRSSGPWRDAQRIIFIPLQVQSDTNILLHSPHCKTMADLVSMVHHCHHEKGVAFVVRPHPEEVKTNLKLPSLPDTFIDSRGSLASWIDAADLVVTINSTVGLEALLRNKSVLAIGRGIYAGKGMTDGVPACRERVRTYHEFLLSHHTCSPRSGLPGCMVSAFPAREPILHEPLNHHGLDPASCGRDTAKARDRLRQEAMAAGMLHIVAPAECAFKLALDYRNHASPFEIARFRDRLRLELDLPCDFPIEFGTELPSGQPFVFLESVNPSHPGAPVVDRYATFRSPALA